MFRQHQSPLYLFKIFSLLVIALATCAHSYPQGQSGSRLREVDRLCSSSRGGAAYDQLAKLVLERAYLPELQELTGIEMELASAQKDFFDNPKQHGVSDSDVTAAFDEWRHALRDPNLEPTSPYQLFRFRSSLAHFAPSLISKDENGITSDRLSPVEAVYLFDFLVANGGVPRVSIVSGRAGVPGKQTATQEASVAGYTEHWESYVANTAPTERAQKLTKILHAHLLK